MATPILADLKAAYPKASITAMCQSNVASLITHDPNIDSILSFDKPKGLFNKNQAYEIIEPLKEGGFDLSILLTNSFSSAWWFWRAGVKNRLGYACNLRSPLLTCALPFPKNIETQHLIDTYKMLLNHLGVSVSDRAPKLYLTDFEIKHAKKMLEKYGFNEKINKVVGINPGAAYGSAKCWLPERFRKVTHDLLKDESVFVVYFGDSSQIPLIDQILKKPNSRVINLAGKTSIRELMALISICKVFLTNDSGPMHIAYALNTPTLALFGSTNHIKTGPCSPGKVIYKKVECSPCYKRVCPIDFRCMKGISADVVIHKLRSELENCRRKT